MVLFEEGRIVLDILNILNSERQELKFTTEFCPCGEVLGTCSSCPKKIPFLYCMVSLHSLTKDSGIIVQQLKTQTYSKPTDIHKYIPPSSCTPNLSVRSPAIIKGVAHRLRMTNTEDGDLLTALNNYSGYLEASGYDRKAIMKHFHSIMDTSNQALVSTVKVQDSSFKCSLVVKMHPALPDIRDVMRKFLPTLSRCPLASSQMEPSSQLTGNFLLCLHIC